MEKSKLDDLINGIPQTCSETPDCPLCKMGIPRKKHIVAFVRDAETGQEIILETPENSQLAKMLKQGAKMIVKIKR